MSVGAEYNNTLYTNVNLSFKKEVYGNKWKLTMYYDSRELNSKIYDTETDINNAFNTIKNGIKNNFIELDSIFN